MTDQAVITTRQLDLETERSLWEKYEQRKAQLDQQSLSPAEYSAACQRIADELGI